MLLPGSSAPLISGAEQPLFVITGAGLKGSRQSESIAAARMWRRGMLSRRQVHRRMRHCQPAPSKTRLQGLFRGNSGDQKPHPFRVLHNALVRPKTWDRIVLAIDLGLGDNVPATSRPSRPKQVVCGKRSAGHHHAATRSPEAELDGRGGLSDQGSRTVQGRGGRLEGSDRMLHASGSPSALLKDAPGPWIMATLPFS